MSADVSTTAEGPAGVEPERSELSFGAILRRLGRGEFGPVRVILAIAVIWTIFQLANDRFLSAVNLTNLTLQIAAVATISIGVVLVLLLGEIDLSVGSVSGFAAGVMAVLTVKEGVDPWLAIAAGLGVGVLIGLFNGFFVTVFGIPSFVVTLAGLIGWNGALLLVLGDTGTVPLPPSIITDLTGTFFDPVVGWVVAVAVVVFYVASVVVARARRVRAGLQWRRSAGDDRTRADRRGDVRGGRDPERGPRPPARAGDRRRADGVALLHHRAHPVRQVHLRRRRQRRGGEAPGSTSSACG